MKSREEELAGKVGALLDQAVADLRPGLAYRLQQARTLALDRLAESEQTQDGGRLVGAHGLIGAGAGGADLPTGSQQRRSVLTGRTWLGIGMVAVAILGWQQWVAWQELAEVEDLDSQILTSDLPVAALVDRGFHLFLEVAPTLPEPEAAEEPTADAPAEEAPDATVPAADAAPATEPSATQGPPAPAKPAE